MSYRILELLNCRLEQLLEERNRVRKFAYLKQHKEDLAMECSYLLGMVEQLIDDEEVL